MNNTQSRILLDQLTGGQLDWAPMDDQFDEVSLFGAIVEDLIIVCISAHIVMEDGVFIVVVVGFFVVGGRRGASFG